MRPQLFLVCSDTWPRYMVGMPRICSACFSVKMISVDICVIDLPGLWSFLLIHSGTKFTNIPVKYSVGFLFSFTY